MARRKWTSLLALMLLGGCSTGHPVWPQYHPESPQYVGRNCTATRRPDGTPDYSAGCTANDRLYIEGLFDH